MASRKKSENRPRQEGWRTWLYDVIFGHESWLGWLFDVALLIAILLSVIVVCVETLPVFDESSSALRLFLIAEIVFTAIFTVEYILRLSCVASPLKYALSFFGIIDLLAVLPSLVALGFFAVEHGSLPLEGAAGGAGSYGVIRAFRLLRVFRILKLGSMMKEANELGSAIWRSRGKIVVFVGTVMITVVIAGSLMYEIENPQGSSDSPFSSIPEAIYWAIVTMTTVGYGDITPETGIGKFVAALLILLGYSLIIVPTGFVSAEVISSRGLSFGDKTCPQCKARGHDADANYCKHCGRELS